MTTSLTSEGQTGIGCEGERREGEKEGVKGGEAIIWDGLLGGGILAKLKTVKGSSKKYGHSNKCGILGKAESLTKTIKLERSINHGITW